MKYNFVLFQLRLLMIIIIIYIIVNQFTKLIKYYEQSDLWVISGFDVPVHVWYAYALLKSPSLLFTPAENPNLFHFLLLGVLQIELKIKSLYIYFLIIMILLAYIAIIGYIYNKFLKSYIDSLLIATGLILGNYQFQQSIAEGLYPYLLALLLLIVYLFILSKSTYRLVLLLIILYTNIFVFVLALIFEILTVISDLTTRQNKSLYNKRYFIILFMTLFLGIHKIMAVLEATYYALSGQYQEAIGSFRPSIFELSVFMYNSNYTLFYYIFIYAFLVIISIAYKKLFNINHHVYFLVLIFLLLALSDNVLARTARTVSLFIPLFIFYNFKEVFNISYKKDSSIFYLIIYIYLLPLFINLLQGGSVVNYYYQLDPDILNYYNEIKDHYLSQYIIQNKNILVLYYITYDDWLPYYLTYSFASYDVYYYASGSFELHQITIIPIQRIISPILIFNNETTSVVLILSNNTKIHYHWPSHIVFNSDCLDLIYYRFQHEHYFYFYSIYDRCRIIVGNSTITFLNVSG